MFPGTQNSTVPPPGVVSDIVREMLFGLTQVCLPCRDLDRSLSFYSDSLGFSLVARSEGQIDLDANGSGIRLLLAAGDIGAAVRVRLHTSKPDQSWQILIERGVTAGAAPHRSPAGELVAEIFDPDGHCLELWRALSEDELEYVPALPTSLEWTDEAVELLQKLLASVPASFRGPARGNTVATAEYLAGSSLRVGRQAAVRGFIRATPRLRRENLKPALREQGIDPEVFSSDFDS